MLKRSLLGCAVLLALAATSFAQSATANNLNRNNAERGSNTPNTRDDEDIRLGRPETEMLDKRQLEYAKKNYEEHLARARETARLGASLRAGFVKKQRLDKEELKDLERVEKLAKKIRERMSEESDATPLKENFPATLEEALMRLDKGSQELEKQALATPRNVVSAKVMETACEVEALARYIREHWGK